MSVTIETEPRTNSADFDPIFPHLSPFFVSERRRLASVVRRLLRIASNGLKCYSELARDHRRNLRFAMCSQSS